MKLLAFDTTNKTAIAVLKNNEQIDSLILKNKHSEHLMNEIDSILTQNNLLVSNLDCLGVVTGPGSFTGIRIGIAIVKAISYALKTPIISVNSFEVVAYNVKESNFMIVLNAETLDHYYAIFKNKQMTEYGIKNVQELNEYAKTNNLLIFCRQNDDIVGLNVFKKIDINFNTFASLITEKYLKNELCQLNYLKPMYIKLSQAEKNLNEKFAESIKIDGATDYKEIFELDQKCFTESRWSEEEFKNELKLKDRKYWVAKYDQISIGYLGLQDFETEWNILKFCVLPEYRTKGVGTKLLKEIVEQFKNSSAKQIFLEMRKTNKNAESVYLKFGFKPVYTRPHYYKNGDDCVVMFLKKEIDEKKV